MEMLTIRGVECYGALEENSNFDLVFDNEDDDFIWVDGNPNSSEHVFSSWEEVVNFFIDEEGMTDLIEIVAV
jgi:hypothetical protein